MCHDNLLVNWNYNDRVFPIFAYANKAEESEQSITAHNNEVTNPKQHSSLGRLQYT
jgi:hypothetical protein